MIVLLGWQYFVVEPKLAAERARQAELQKLQDGADGFELRKDADVVAPDSDGLGVDALNAQQGEASIDIEFADISRGKRTLSKIAGTFNS